MFANFWQIYTCSRCESLWLCHEERGFWSFDFGLRLNFQHAKPKNSYIVHRLLHTAFIVNSRGAGPTIRFLAAHLGKHFFVLFNEILYGTIVWKIWTVCPNFATKLCNFTSFQIRVILLFLERWLCRLWFVECSNLCRCKVQRVQSISHRPIGVFWKRSDCTISITPKLRAWWLQCSNLAQFRCQCRLEPRLGV